MAYQYVGCLAIGLLQITDISVSGGRGSGAMRYPYDGRADGGDSIRTDEEVELDTSGFTMDTDVGGKSDSTSMLGTGDADALGLGQGHSEAAESLVS